MWRATFLDLAEVTDGFQYSQHDISRTFEYIQKNLPFVWQFGCAPHVFVESEKHDFAQMGFFARIFDVAVQVRRHGLDYLYTPKTFAQGREYCIRAYHYAREKYPFVPFNLPMFFGHVLVDALCEDLWYYDWDPKQGTRIGERSLLRVFSDFFGDDPFIQDLERYCPRLTDELVHAPVSEYDAGFQTIKLSAVHEELYEVGEPSYNWPTRERTSKVFRTAAYPRYEKHHCEPVFLRIEYRQHLQDPNWIKYPNQKVIFPRKLQVLRFPIPAIPLISTKEGELSEVILHCILKDRFFFQQKKWYIRVPVILLEYDVWYFNSSFYNFDREEMRMKLIDVMTFGVT